MRNSVDEILALERHVWQALVDGDAAADAAMLAEEFLGLYETGYGDKAEHVEQLSGGPSVSEFELHDTRLMQLADELVLLTYRAEFRRAGAGHSVEAMWVSSIWRREGDEWKNVFSQDTPAGDTRPV